MKFSKPLSVAMSAAMVVAFSPAASAFATGEGQVDQPAAQESQAEGDVTAGRDLAGKDGSLGYYRVVDKAAKTAEFVLSKASGTTVEVPSKIMLSDNEEYSVVSVASKAFFGMQKLTGATVGEGVKAIGDRAFEECVNLKSIELPQSLETIGNDAFFYCTRLASAKLPAGLKSLGTGAFYGSGLTSINIPDNVTAIERYTFARCESLKKVTGMAGMMSIAARAFQGCLVLKAVELHEGLVSIGDRGFDSCEMLKDITLPKSLETIGEWSFNDCMALESVSLNVKDVPKCAFTSCSSLMKVELRDGVESIGESAFSSCDGWTNVKLPKTVNKIDPQAFSSFWLESFSVAEGSESYSSVNGVLYNAAKTELVRYPEHKKGTSYKPVAGTVKIADYAFFDVRKLTSLNLSGVEEVGESAAYNADKLKSVKFDNSLKSIGESSFYGTALKSVSLPASLKELPKDALGGCYNLKSVKLGGVEKIASGALSDDGTLKSITIPATATDIAGDFATGVAVSKYKLAAGSKSFKLVDGVLYSADGKTLVSCPSAYRNAKKKYSLKIASGCETIGEYALSTTSLTSVSIPASVTTIKTGAFENISQTVGAKGIKIPATVTTIEEKAVGYDNNYGMGGACPGALIVGKRGSAAEKYALDNDFAFATSTPKMTIKKAKLAKKGKTTTVSVKGMQPGQVKFYSSDKRVVKVDANGKVTAVGAGKTNVVAAMGTFYMHVNVSVGGKKASASVDPYSSYKSVTSKKALKAWEKKYYAANKGKSFSKASNPAIRCYTTNDYVAIKAMQGDKKYIDRAKDNYGDDIEEYGEVSTLLKWELGKFNLPVNMELFSGIGSVDAYTGTTTSLDDMQASIGKMLTHPVVISTSLFDDTAYGFASGTTATVIHIYAPKNKTVGGYLYKFSAFPTEYELLLANDAQFKVVDCGVKYGKHHSAQTYEGSNDKVYERYYTLEYLG